VLQLSSSRGSVKVLARGGSNARKWSSPPICRSIRGRGGSAQRHDGFEIVEGGLSALGHTAFEVLTLITKLPPEVSRGRQEDRDHAKLADTNRLRTWPLRFDRQSIWRPRRSPADGESDRHDGSEISVLKVEKRVRTPRKRHDGEAQREYFSTKTAEGVQNEIGRRGRPAASSPKIEDKIKKTKLSKEGARRRPTRSRSWQISPMSRKSARRAQNYLDCCCRSSGIRSPKINNESRPRPADPRHDHYGVEKVKARIVEYLAVRRRANKMNGPTVLVGPPGVGKTSSASRSRRRAGRDIPLRVSIGGDMLRRDPGPRHLYRLEARQDHTVDAQGQDLESCSC